MITVLMPEYISTSESKYSNTWNITYPAEAYYHCLKMKLDTIQIYILH